MRVTTMQHSGPESSLFFCNAGFPRLRNAILYFLIILGCTWTVLHVWFWGVQRSCSGCKPDNTERRMSNIRTVLQQMMSDGENTPSGRSWCRNKTRQLDSLMVNLTGPDIKPDNPELVKVLRTAGFDLPSPYLAKMSYPLFKTPQAEVVEKITEGMRGGFFVECGALDGERSSNTIYLEQKKGWSGLLIEMDPSWYQQIRGKNRKSFSLNACISPYQYPIKMDFKEHIMGEGKLVVGGSESRSESQKKVVHIHKVYCYPFFTMMLALNQTHIDYFSLDVEGFELTILKTIPFDKLDISIFTVEFIHGKEGEWEYRKYMESQGYYVHSKIKKVIPQIYFGANDLVFVKNGYTPS